MQMKLINLEDLVVKRHHYGHCEEDKWKALIGGLSFNIFEGF
jgi:hypothetical protein